MMSITLSKKEREIINIAASITSGCQPCSKYHIKKGKESGVSESEIKEIIEQVGYLNKISVKILQEVALSNLSKGPKKKIDLNLNDGNKKEILVGLTVSYTINNTDLFEFYIDKSILTDIGILELSYIMKTSRFISDKAKAHVELLGDSRGAQKKDYDNDDCNITCCC